MIGVASDWNSGALDDLVTHETNGVDPIDADGLPYVGLEHIDTGEISLSRSGDPATVRSRKTRFGPGDILYGKLRPYLDKAVLAEKSGICSTDILVLRPKHRIDPYFVGALLHLKPFVAHAVATTTGVNHPRTSWNAIRKYEIAVPLLSEQRAIAHVLRTVQQTKEATEQVIAAAKELKKSMVSEYVARDELPEAWSREPVANVASRVEYGISKRGTQTGAYPILRMNSISEGQVETDDLQWVDLTSEEFDRFRLTRGDVLFNRTNSIEKVGKSAYFDLDGDWVFASYLLRVAAKPDVLEPRFLNYFLGAPSTRTRLRELATRAVSQANINATKLRGLTMPVPPLSEQREIANAVGVVDRKIAAEEARRDAFATLFDSLLHDLMTAKLRVNDLFPEVA